MICKNHKIAAFLLFALFTGAAADCSSYVLRRGSRGDCVKTLQRALGITADGIFGSGTEASVKSFQRRKGLAADGIVGRKTWAAISSLSGSNSGSGCGSGNKELETLELIFGSEGACQNWASDSGNHLDGRIGYTCMGITPGTGWTHRTRFQCYSAFSGHKADFVKFCYDRNKAAFKTTAASIYSNMYFNGCRDLDQPAFYVCADISVLSGPGRARQFRDEIGERLSAKDYARRLNDLSRAYYKRIGVGKNAKFLQGWLNRANHRDDFINRC